MSTVVLFPGRAPAPVPGAIAANFETVDVNKRVAYMRDVLGGMIEKLEERYKSRMTQGEKAAVDDMLTKLMRAGEESGAKGVQQVEEAFRSGRVDQIADTLKGGRRRKTRKSRKRSTRKRRSAV